MSKPPKDHPLDFVPLYLPQQGLHNLKKYRYSCVDKSLVARYIMQPIWTAMIELVPMWMAYDPKAVFTFNILQSQSGYPSWVLLYRSEFLCINLLQPFLDWRDACVGLLIELCVLEKELTYTAQVCLFLYQTLDALDGKQARRTGKELGCIF